MAGQITVLLHIKPYIKRLHFFIKARRLITSRSKKLSTRKPKYKFWKVIKIKFWKETKNKEKKPKQNFERGPKILEGNQKFWRENKKFKNEI